MDFLELVAKRQSDRAFDPSRPVEREKLERIMHAAHMAPSACNAQPWSFIVVDDAELRKQVSTADSSSKMGMNPFAKDAGAHILVIEDRPNLESAIGSLVKRKEFPQIDNGIAIAHIVLAATAEGLGTCILGWIDESKMKKILNIPKRKRILVDIVVGYSTQTTREKRRKPFEKVVRWNMGEEE